MRVPIWNLAVLIATLAVGDAPAIAATESDYDGPYRHLSAAELRTIGTPPRPGYPYWARRQHSDAILRLRVYVSRTGKVDAVRVTKSFGDQQLINYAAKFARANWHCRPWVVNNQPVAFYFDMPLAFVLDSRSSNLHRRGYVKGQTNHNEFLERYGN